MKVAAVSHFDDDATSSGVDPVTESTPCSWRTVPSSATMRRYPPLSPAFATRASSAASGPANASGAYVREGARVVVDAREVGLVVDDGAEVVVESAGSVRWAPDPEQAARPATSATDATNARIRCPVAACPRRCRSRRARACWRSSRTGE
jgi:hypothetical protein